MKPIIIVEHCEAEMYEWSKLEYQQLSNYVPENQLWFTNTSDKSLKEFGRVIPMRASVVVEPEKTIILDPKGEKMLSADDLEHFDYFVIGGILGDKEFNGRTGVELSKSIPGATLRNLGPRQFSVDNAVYVVMKILGGEKFDDMEFVDEVELEFGDTESVSLPYRYPVIEGRPLINPKLIQMLRDGEEF